MKCLYAWTQAYVHYDGSVRPCCGGPIIGNIHEKPLVEIFNSEMAKYLRQDFRSDDMPECFKNCPNLSRVGTNIKENYFIPKSVEKYSEKDLVALNNYNVVCDSYNLSTSRDIIKPISIIVSLGEACNLRCRMCPQDHNNPVFLNRDALNNIVSSMDCCLFITVTGGEPLVYSSFWDFADIFIQNSSSLSTFSLLTNAQLLTPDLIKTRFCNIPNLALGINIDSCKKETYEYIRKNGKWDKLLRNIKFIVEYKNKNDKHWNINLGFTIMKSNLHELSGAIMLAKELGVGMGVGPITGNYHPIDKMRFYLQENIFLFPQNGYEKKDINKVLSEALLAADNLEEDVSRGLKNNILGVIEYLKNIKQIDIKPHQMQRISQWNDDKLKMIVMVITDHMRYSILFEIFGLIIWYFSTKYPYSLKFYHKIQNRLTNK